MACIACALVMSTMTAVAHAGDTPSPDSAVEARRQYELGSQAFAQKAYVEAALHFEAAAALKPNAVALYTAALAWDLAQRPDRAADDFARSLDIPGLDANKTASVKERLAALERTVGTLLVTAPPGWKVGLDQSTEVPAPVRLHGVPGEHELHVHAPNRPVDHQDVTFEAGAVKPLELKDEPKPPPPDPVPEVVPPPAPPPPPPPPPREGFWSGSRAIGVGILGAGLAAIGAGVVLGVNANGAKDAYDAAPTRAGFDHASSLETWTNVTLVSGAVLAAGGILLVVLPVGRSETRAELRAAPGGLVARGTF